MNKGIQQLYLDFLVSKMSLHRIDAELQFRIRNNYGSISNSHSTCIGIIESNKLLLKYTTI